MQVTPGAAHSINNCDSPGNNSWFYRLHAECQALCFVL